MEQHEKWLMISSTSDHRGRDLGSGGRREGYCDEITGKEAIVINTDGSVIPK